jgi:hypothetical protein
LRLFWPNWIADAQRVGSGTGGTPEQGNPARATTLAARRLRFYREAQRLFHEGILNL